MDGYNCSNCKIKDCDFIDDDYIICDTIKKAYEQGRTEREDANSMDKAIEIIKGELLELYRNLNSMNAKGVTYRHTCSIIRELEKVMKKIKEQMNG